MAEPRPWQDQLRGSITREEELERLVRLSAAEREGIRAAGPVYRWRITPYYASLMDPEDPACPIRRQAIPSAEELVDPDGIEDPIGEEAGTVAPNTVRLYPDRAAWCVSGTCPVYCRFCFRRRLVGRDNGDFSPAALAAGLEYLGRTPQIRDVLITGGDPLMLPDRQLEDILRELRRIRHLEIIRIGTRAPVTLPQRVTPELCAMLRRYHPLWVNTHFNHPAEITPQAAAACGLLADAGIPLGNQSVLLRGVNDDVEVMRQLSRRLVAARVRPYYLFQCHLVRGTAHFRARIETGVSLVSALRGSTTGFSVPAFVVDTPHGKVQIGPENVAGRDTDGMYLRCPDGAVWYEKNPAPEPADIGR
jgi:lysine 2,3-aminomutase